MNRKKQVKEYTYTVCKRCILNNGPLTYTTFDDKGICNNCRNFEALAKKTLWISRNRNNKKLKDILSTIKKVRGRSGYDCILGLSGGADSSYLAYMAHAWGLHPLVVHFDNGWNSEIAVKNIHAIVNKLGYDLYTYVIDWDEFRDIQLAYVKASVIDLEVPTDHFIYATLYEIAQKRGIKYILDGNNIATEFPGGSWKWNYSKIDLINLLNIHKKFGTIKLRKFPKLGLFQRLYYQHIARIKTVYLLNYVDYNKKKAKETLKKELGWKDYGGKHYESIFTRFYQGYMLPKKFNIDKRRIHFSNLIWSGQMTRREALRELKKPTYSKRDQELDKTYVLKKFGLHSEEFEKMMRAPIVPHEVYGTEDQKYSLLIYIPTRVMRISNSIKKKVN